MQVVYRHLRKCAAQHAEACIKSHKQSDRHLLLLLVLPVSSSLQPAACCRLWALLMHLLQPHSTAITMRTCSVHGYIHHEP